MAIVAFLGLGNMGAPMAKNLIRAGHTVRVYDLFPEAVTSLVADGGEAAASPADAANGADVVISMLPAGQHVAQLYLGDEGLLQQLPAGTLVLDCSTIDVATAQRVAQAASRCNIDFMDTPVSGGVAAAAAGTLAFMCGGQVSAFARAKPVLEGMGNAEKIFHAGDAGAGQVAKAVNNMLLAVHMIGTCEALAMGAASGLDPAVLSEIMKASSGNNWSLQVYNPYPGVMPTAPASNDYKPGFMVDLMVKDLGLAMAVAEQSGVSNPMGQLAQTLYQSLQSEGAGQEDFSSIMRQVQKT